MRLTLKLTLGILFGVALTLLVNGVVAAGRESDLLESDMKRDHLVLGHALAVDVMEELRDRGSDDALRLVERMNAERAGIDISAVLPAALPAAVAGTLLDGRVLQRIEDVDGDEQLVTWLPLLSRGRLTLALSLRESLAPGRAYVRTAMFRRTVIAVVGLGGSALIAWVFGFLVVGRPVRALVAKARRVGDGDLAGPLPTDRRDELGVLAAELNAMCLRLDSARAELVRASEERIAAVQQLRRADRLSTLGLLAAGLAHELGTPLNVVAGRARLIADRAGAAPDVAQNAERIEEQAHRMTRIVRQLLDFARARTPHKSSVDVVALARDTADMIGALSEKRGVGVAVEAAAPVTAVVDADQIRQALTNLIVNAVHASERGKGVRVDVRGEDGRVRVAVVDEGVGMDPDTLKQIFTPFFTTKDVGEGTGLGLAVAWGLVEENGGHISVTSTAGQGSCFTLELPAEAT